MKRVLACAAVLSLVGIATIGADVKTKEKSQVQFPGALGRVVNIFGGKAAREGVVSTVAVSGNRKMRADDNAAEIVDLGEEKVYNLDLRKKTYTVTTFEQLRQKMREAEAKAREEARKSEGKSEQPGKEYEVDFDAKETGQRKSINSYDCREVVTTVTVREKGKTLEQAGGMVLRANMWMAPAIPEMKELADFDMRYAKQLYGADAVASAEQMAAVMAAYPGLKAALDKFRAQKVNMDGTPLETSVTVQAVMTAEQAAREEKADEPQAPEKSVGGMLGGLGRRIGRKKEEPAASADKGRATVMTMTNQVLSVSTSVAASEVAIPAGFTQK